MKRIIVTLALVVGIVATLAAFDGMGERNGWQGKKHHNGMMMNQKMQHHDMEYPMGMLCENLDLSDAQKENIEKFRLDHQKDMIRLRADIKILNIDKRAALQKQDFAKAKKMIGKIYELKEQKELKKNGHHEDIWNELTPEQQQEAKKLQPGKMHKKMMNNTPERHHKNWYGRDEE